MCLGFAFQKPYSAKTKSTKISADLLVNYIHRHRERRPSFHVLPLTTIYDTCDSTCDTCDTYDTYDTCAVIAISSASPHSYHYLNTV